LEATLDDAAMVEGLRAGKSEAREAFWRAYWDILYPISAHILGPGPDAMDVTVDLLVEFMDERVSKLENPKALYEYLRLTAVRRCIRLRDKGDKRAPLDENLRDHSGASPEEWAAAAMLMPRLKACLNTITPKAQKTLRLKFGNQMTNERIGGLVGGSKQYIGRLIQKSLQTLRECIENKDLGQGSSA
jgi:RNA polymerase sigma-70 factor (ECF subfamily)